MADRYWNPTTRSLLVGRVDIMGSFAPNGSGAVASSSVNGKGFTVSRVSAGLFRVQLANQFPKLIAATVSLQLAAGDDKAVQLGTYNATSKTVDIRVWDTSGAAETDVAANANNRIHFNLTFSNSTVD